MTPSSTEPSSSTGVAFTLDTSSFPRVKLTLRGALPLRDAEAMSKAIEERVFSRKANYTLLVDATHAGVPGADVRRHFGEFSIKNKPNTRRYCKGEAYVMPNALVRGALTAVMWLSPFEHPHKVFGTVNEARAWLDGQGA